MPAMAMNEASMASTLRASAHHGQRNQECQRLFAGVWNPSHVVRANSAAPTQIGITIPVLT